MRSLITRVEKLEQLKQSDEVKCIFYHLVGHSKEDVLAYIGKNKSFYKREDEDYESFKERVMDEVPQYGIHSFRASYE